MVGLTTQHVPYHIRAIHFHIVAAKMLSNVSHFVTVEIDLFRSWDIYRHRFLVSAISAK
jgi:hypothetical protein